MIPEGFFMQEIKIRRLVVLHVKNGQVTFRIHQMLLVFLLKTIIIVEIQTWKKSPGVILWIQIYDGNFVPHDLIQKKKIGVHHIMSVWPRILKGDSDVGDIVMLVTLWWWLISDFGGRIIMSATSFEMLPTMLAQHHIGDFLNILNRSPTHFVSNIRHKHRCNL